LQYVQHQQRILYYYYWALAALLLLLLRPAIAPLSAQCGMHDACVIRSDEVHVQLSLAAAKMYTAHF
jgi:hypothetical protein